MDFTRLNLKPYRIDEGVATGNNALEAENRATENSINNSAPKQIDPNKKEMQLKQRTAKIGSPTTSQAIVSSYDHLLDVQSKKEMIKLYEKEKTDWRKELLEAANPDDDPNHPFVEIMPSTAYKAKEAEENIKKGVKKSKMDGAGPGRSGLDEELLNERSVSTGDPAPVKHKKDTGKALSKGSYKGAVKNKDNTASPKENVGRRIFNKNPQMKGDLQDKIKPSVTTDAFDN